MADVRPDTEEKPGPLVLLLFGLVLVTLVLGAGELAVRFRERHRSDAPGTIPTIFYRHPRLGHALVRNYDYFGRIHIDGQGFRGPDVKLTPDSGVVRVMTVGASTTFDSFVSGDAHTWSIQLGEWLNRLLPGRRIEVINAGVPGYTVIDNAVRLETELYQYRPDLIILYEVHNDLFAALRQGAVPRRASNSDTPEEVPPMGSLVHWLTRHSLLYTKFADKWEIVRFNAAGRKPANGPAPNWPDALARGTSAYERDLGLELEVARTLGIKAVVTEVLQISGNSMDESDPAVAGVWHSSVPWAPIPTVLEAYRQFNETARRVAEHSGATFLPTGDFGLKGRQWYAVGDPVHFNDNGSARMAEMLARALISHGVIR